MRGCPLGHLGGKWQLNGMGKWSGWDDPDRLKNLGFDEHCLWQSTTFGERYPNPVIEKNGKVLETTIDDYGPDIISDYILEFIERHQDGPFFVYYPMILVHSPFRPTPDSPEWPDESRRMENDDCPGRTGWVARPCART